MWFLIINALKRYVQQTNVLVGEDFIIQTPTKNYSVLMLESKYSYMNHIQFKYLYPLYHFTYNKAVVRARNYD